MNQLVNLDNGKRAPLGSGAFALAVWLLAGTAMFLPFASDTSPWDAVTFRVPGNQGNWWHFLVGLPFLILFMAGVSTDLLEGRYALAANTIVGGVLVANATIDVYGLLHLTARTR